MNEKKIGFGLISLILGIIAVVSSPSIIYRAFLIFMDSNIVVVIVTFFASIATAFLAFVLGIVAVTRKDLLGWVGIILAIVAGLMILIPVLYVMVTPIA